MVKGIDSFRQWFQGFEGQYVIIGGTAGDLLMGEAGLDFRATKDIDLVLLIEALTPKFGKRFWEYVVAGQYKHRNNSTGVQEFYRFSKPAQVGYPEMIELFSRRPADFSLPPEAKLSPLPMDESISSLSAILLDDEYYKLLQNGTIVVDGIRILDAAHLILFKAKAWIDLTSRNQIDGSVDSRHIKKHKNDVFRLAALLTPEQKITVSGSVWNDLMQFIESMREEDVELKQIKAVGRDKNKILDDLMNTYEKS